MTRNRIQAVASEVLADGNDFWDFWREPVDIASLCGELGLPDSDKVRAHTEALIQSGH